MKKLVLATAVAALSVSAAHAAPTVYGKVFLTVDATSSKVKGEKRVDDRVQLNSNFSRIGVKGAEAISENTDVVYQLEYGVKVDDNSPQFIARDSYVGLSNKQYGTLLAGRLSAIDGRVDYANVTAGGIASGVLAEHVDANRANNAIAYVSPTVNGLTASAMYVLDEVKNSDNGRPNDTFNHDAFGVAVQYEPKDAAFRAGASYVQADELKAARVSGAVDATPAITLGALYQHTKYEKGVKGENLVTVSADVKTATPWNVYGQVDVVSDRGADKKAQRYVVGGKYAFNKATTGHVYGAFTHNNNNGLKGNAGGIGGGLEYKF